MKRLELYVCACDLSDTTLMRYRRLCEFTPFFVLLAGLRVLTHKTADDFDAMVTLFAYMCVCLLFPSFYRLLVLLLSSYFSSNSFLSLSMFIRNILRILSYDFCVVQLMVIDLICSCGFFSVSFSLNATIYFALSYVYFFTHSIF